MKTKYITYLTLPLALAFAACSSDNEPAPSADEQVEIQLTASLAGQTESRAFDLDTKWDDLERVYLTVHNAGNLSTPLYAQMMTVDGNTLTGATKMYFPINGDPVLIRSLAVGLSNSSDIILMGGSLSFPIQIHGGQSYKGGYARADLCYAVKDNVARTSSPVELEYHHILSKIEIVLNEGKGDTGFLTNSNMREINLLNLPQRATITLGEHDATATFSDLESYSDAVLSNLLGEANEGIIIPQTLAAGTEFIKVTVDGGEWTYKLPAAMEFKSGYKYRFNLTLNATSLDVTYTVADWNTGESFNEELDQDIK